MMEVESILKRCNLDGLKQDSNGWRAKSPFRVRDGMKPDDGNGSLSISKEGLWKCHATERTGNIVTLYAEARNLSPVLARKELKSASLIPSNYVEVADKKEERDDPMSKVSIDGVLGKSAPMVEADLLRLTEWRKVSRKSLESCTEVDSLRVTNYKDKGYSVVFINSEPPVMGEAQRVRGLHLRHPDNDQKWSTVGSYPIWAPKWFPQAGTVAVFEGEWDALAFMDFLPLTGEPEGTLQPLAICGGKDIKSHPEILEYFRGKKVVFCFDRDEAGRKHLAAAYEALEGYDCERVKIETPVNDFNEWSRNGIVEQSFRSWWATPEDFYVRSNGSLKVIVDDEYCKLHHLRKDGFFLIDDQGAPVQVHSSKVMDADLWNAPQLLEWIKPYPMLHEYVTECATAQESPILWHIMVFLTFFGAALGRRVKFSSGANSRLFPNLFTILIGESGMGKSQSISMLQSLVKEASNRTTFIGSCKFSGEAIGDELVEDPHRIYMFDEFSEWMPKNEGSYKFDALKMALQMYDGDRYDDKNTYRFNFRKKGGAQEIKSPSISMIAGCLPSQITDATQDQLRGGLFGRCLFVFGRNKHRAEPFPRGVSAEVREKLKKFFIGVFSTPFRDFASMEFSDKARALYIKKFNENERRFQNMKFSDDTQTYMSRWRPQILKFAMLFELLSGRQSFPLDRSDIRITSDSLVTAINFVELLRKTFLHLFQERLVRNELSRDGKIQERILKYMKEHASSEGVMKSDLYRFLRENEGALSGNLNVLEESGQLMKQEIRCGRSHPKSLYFLPKAKDEQSKRSGEETDTGDSEPIAGGGQPDSK